MAGKDQESGTATADKPKKGRKSAPKNLRLEGFEDEVADKFESLMQGYVDAKAARMEALDEESKIKKEIGDLMKEHKQRSLVILGRRVQVEKGEEKVTIKKETPPKKKDEEGEKD